MQNKTVLIVLACLSLPILYLFTGPVVIKLNNKTGHNLNAISICKKPPFDLVKGESKIFLFRKFSFDSGLPDETIEANLLGKPISNDDRNYDCGTQKYEQGWGYFNITIECDTIENQLSLDLVRP